MVGNSLSFFSYNPNYPWSFLPQEYTLPFTSSASTWVLPVAIFTIGASKYSISSISFSLPLTNSLPRQNVMPPHENTLPSVVRINVFKWVNATYATKHSAGKS